ncbi:sugar phosphate isomerase/epimerase [Catalinimonas alkaloidigena]|uniref:sugar phosphate isomerase/epimerase family protein n=1 Tax=Catalinimonas alkaloidigena TaxID=1075417 RepID=UPI002405B860|nr:TIM barrel protein [Catalinimonas alkaloidigena]MDF9799894.1 sugar phosphate isomerase/epimerase [Catalinimonas alkaloidigena]
MSLIRMLFLFLIISPLCAQEQLDNPFFVFNNGLKDAQYDSPEAQVQLLLDNGYDGMEKEGLENFEEVLNELHENDLKLFTIYINVNLDNPEQPYDPRLEEVFQKIQGTGAMPWLYVTGKQHPSSSPEYDQIAIPILQQIADMAQQYGTKVMLYPHMYYWVECIEDAMRVAAKVDRPNLGYTFNLCHFLAHKNREGVDPVQAYPLLAKQSMPRLFAISVNGADIHASDPDNIWQSYIQPLGEGNFDTYQFVKTFVDLGFNGPVGLQCYNIKEDKAVHLQKSMQSWRKYQQRMSSSR